MEERFIHIATIVLQHNYFDAGVLPSFTFKATSPTITSLDNLSVLIKPFSGGIHVLTSQPEQLETVDSNIIFFFELYNQDPYFINYTALSGFSPSSDVFYFDNLDLVPNEETKTFRLSEEPYVTSTEKLRVIGERFQLNHFNESEQYTFTAADGQEIPQQEINQRAINGMVQNDFILHNLSPGKILVSGSLNTSESLYFQPANIYKKPFGCLALYPAQLYAHYKSIEQKTVMYAIPFEARKAYWKYIIKGLDQHRKQLVIEDVDKNLDFDQIIEGTDTTLFTSKKPLALSEKPKISRQLIQKTTSELGEDKTLIAHLPQPTAQQLYPNENGEGEIPFSHIYIHI